MAGKELFLDPSCYDLNNVIADIEEIRRYNPQRHEMEQLTAIVHDDCEGGIIVGYKDLTQDEFWVRGHMPDMPLMPGVIMCEAAAQLCSYFVQKHDMLGVEMVGFGGLTDVRFRDVVPPGNRLVIIARLLKLRRGALILSEFQGLVNDVLVVEGKIKGIPLPVEMIRAESST